MNAYRDSKIKMYRATENYCDANSTIISTNVALQAAFNDFKAKIAAILQLAQQDGVPLTGITIDKNVSKEKLIEHAVRVAGAIYAYASTVGSNTLKMEVDVSYSDLAKLRTDALAPRCQSIHDAAEENLAALADYGVSAQMLADLQDAIDDYRHATPKPRTARSERKTVTANLARLFDEADAILKDRMDKLVKLFAATNPDFVKTYESTRRLNKIPANITQLKIRITDKQTAAPIKNAQIKAVPASGDNPPLTAATDATGEHLFKPISPDSYEITVTANGYKNYESEIYVEIGEINDLEVELEK